MVKYTIKNVETQDASLLMQVNDVIDILKHERKTKSLRSRLLLTRFLLEYSI